MLSGSLYGQTITAAEYFIDSDPGEGNGITISATDSFDSSSETVNFTVNTDTLSYGRHWIFVRFKDSNDKWGEMRASEILIGNPNEGQNYITAAEYFVDIDPGEGNGLAMSASDGTFDGTESLTANFNTSNIAHGQHTLYCRAKSINGIWGPLASLTFDINDVVDPIITLTSSISGITSTDSIPITLSSNELLFGLTKSDLIITNGTTANLGENYDFESSFISSDFNNTNTAFGNNYNWYVATDSVKNGTRSLKASLSTTQDSYIRLELNKPFTVKDTLSFWYKTELTESSNNFKFYIDNTEIINKNSTFDWTFYDTTFTNTDNKTLKWEYYNESNHSSDAVWLDDIKILDRSVELEGRSFYILPTSDGVITVDVPAGVIQDINGNNNIAASQFSIVSDRTGAVPTISTELDTIIMNIFNEDFELGTIPGSFVNNNSAYGSNTDYLWKTTNDFAKNGNYCIEVDHCASWTNSTYIEISQNVLRNSTLSFWYKPVLVSTWDKFKFYINGNEVLSSSLASNYNALWTYYDTTFTEANYKTFKWEYYDYNTADCSDGAFLDDIFISSYQIGTNFTTTPITITFDEIVTGFTSADISISSGTLTNFSGSGTTYSFNINSPDAGIVTIDIPSNACLDSYGNYNTAAIQYEYYYEATNPIPIITSTLSPRTNVSTIPITITFTSEVTGFSFNDIAVTNSTISGFNGSGSTYSFNITPTSEGDITINIPSDICEGSGLSNSASDQFSIAYDTTSPKASITSILSSPTNDTTITIDVIFDELVTGFDTSDVIISNGILEGFSGFDTSFYSLNIVPVVDGAITIDVPSGVCTDIAGNTLMEASNYSIIYDSIKPTAVITSSYLSPTTESPIPIKIVFSESVTSFIAEDVVLSNGIISNFNGSDTSYTFDITPNYSDTLFISIPKGAVADSAGNENSVALFNIFYSTYPTVLSVSAFGKSFGKTEIQFHISDQIANQSITDNIIFTPIHSLPINYTLNFDTLTQILSIDLSNTLVSMDTLSITLKSELTNLFGYGFDGDGDGVPGDDYNISFITPMLGDYDENNKIDLIDLGLFINLWESTDFKQELGPVSGQSPHFRLLPDDKFDIEDLVAFVHMWVWYESNTSELSRSFEEIEPPTELAYENSRLYLKIPQNTFVYELSIIYDPGDLKFGKLDGTSEVVMTNNDKERGKFSLLSAAESDTMIVLPITLNCKISDAILQFKASNEEGIIISSMKKDISLSMIPKNYEMKQAFPNPFNPITTIHFNIPDDINVLLEIYDVNGKLVKELNNNNMQAGYHSISWDATTHSSGIYFVKIQAGSFQSTQKIMLIK